jgi:hypothetical protein
MPLPDEVRDLAARVLARLDEARDFYLHTRQAWRVVQQIAHEGRAVGIVDAASGLEVPATHLEPLGQRYVTVHLAESAFKGLSGLLEDWVLGLARLWLAAYPKQLDAAYDEVADRARAASGGDPGPPIPGPCRPRHRGSPRRRSRTSGP